MAELEGKHTIELHIVGDGRVFLNYWDWAHGNDVVAEIKDGKIELHQYDDDGNEAYKIVYFSEYLELVKESIKQINIEP